MDETKKYERIVVGMKIPEWQNEIAERKLHEAAQGVMTSRDIEGTDVEKHRSFELAKSRFHGLEEMACAIGIMTPREVDEIMQYEAKKWMAAEREKEKAEEVLPNSISMDGLRTALERYDENYEHGECGDWKIQGDAALPFHFKILYDGIPVVSARTSPEFAPGGSHYLDLNRENADVSGKVFSQISAIAQSVYMFARPSPDEQKKLDANKKGGIRMKVLIDINEDRMKDLPRIGAKILGTEKDMALDTCFSAEDAWKLIENPEGSFFAFHPFDEEQLRNIESYGREEFLEAVISRLNHGFDAEYGVTWYTIRNAAEEAYNDLVLDKEKSAEASHISLDGLRTALRRYDEAGTRGECGPWEIHTCNYDRWWELCHEGQTLVACYASGKYGNHVEMGNLERERHLDDKTFSSICKIVCEEFPECRMSPEEQKKIEANNPSRGR